jgi:hypothetical protein
MSLILSGTDGLSDVDGSAATPAIRGTDANTGIFFPAADTIAFSEGGAEAMRIDSAGNVGIGTTSPVAKLEVNGNIRINGSGSTLYTTTADLPIQAGGSGVIRFLNNNGANERVRINAAGDFLVGTTSTSVNPGFNLLNYGGGIYANIGHNASAASGDSYAAFWYNGNFIGNIAQSGTTAVSYNTTSDHRLKENIAPMTGALAKVQALKPVTYKWKSDGSDGQGFIAHELAKIVPDCVTGEKDAVDDEGKPKYQGIDTSFLVATLTAAIQELKAELDTVKAELATLKA